MSLTNTLMKKTVIAVGITGLLVLPGCSNKNTQISEVMQPQPVNYGTQEEHKATCDNYIELSKNPMNRTDKNITHAIECTEAYKIKFPDDKRTNNSYTPWISIITNNVGNKTSYPIKKN